MKTKHYTISEAREQSGRESMHRVQPVKFVLTPFRKLSPSAGANDYGNVVMYVSTMCLGCSLFAVRYFDFRDLC